MKSSNNKYEVITENDELLTPDTLRPGASSSITSHPGGCGYTDAFWGQLEPLQRPCKINIYKELKTQNSMIYT